MSETDEQQAVQESDEHTDESTGRPREDRDPADLTDEEVEAERQKRLAPENRPDNVEVDNTDREFDSERGMFTDSEGYEEAEPKFPAEGEQGA